jgi:hypothetical protein
MNTITRTGVVYFWMEWQPCRGMPQGTATRPHYYFTQWEQPKSEWECVFSTYHTSQSVTYSLRICPIWYPIPYTLMPWSKVMNCIGNRLPFRTQPRYWCRCRLTGTSLHLFYMYFRQDHAMPVCSWEFIFCKYSPWAVWGNPYYNVCTHYSPG